MRLRAIGFAAVGAITAIAACTLTNPDSNGCFDTSQHARTCISLETTPPTGGQGSFVVKGDTIRLRTLSDSGYDLASWSIAGDALTATGLSTPSYSIVLTAMKVGSATVTASHSAPPRSAQSTIQVVDSSAIVRILVEIAQFTTSLRVGDSIIVKATPADAAGKFYTIPPVWSVSDPSLARVATYVDGTPRLQAWFVAKAPGTVDVTASLLSTQGSLRFTIVPRL